MTTPNQGLETTGTAESQQLLTFHNNHLSKLKTEPSLPLDLTLTALETPVPVIVRELIQAAISPNTRRAYQADLDHFLSWGGAVPATPDILAQYLAEFAGTLSVATLIRRVASISRAHTTQGMASPSGSDLVRTTLRGIRRTYGVAQRQVAPAVREDILSMVQGLRGTKGVRDRSLLLLGFAGAFRRSELVSLDMADLEFVDRGLLVKLRRSKTDQDGEGRKIAIPFARGAVCPVNSLREWLTTAGFESGPIYRPINRHGDISGERLTGHAVGEIVKERIAALGMDPTKYGGHSLRAGLITSAAALGVPIWKLKAQSGHRSDAILSRYIRDSDLFTNNAAGTVL